MNETTLPTGDEEPPGSPQIHRERTRSPAPTLSRRALILMLTGAGGAALGVAATTAMQREPGPFEPRDLDLGSVDHVLDEIGAAGHLAVDVNGGELIHVVTWDPSYPYNDTTAAAVYGEDHPVLDATTGLMALYLKSPFKACRIRLCESSGFYEDPCHGGAYNRWGEYHHGPRSRGLDRIRMAVTDERVVLRLSPVSRIPGPMPEQTIYQQAPAGPFCILN